MSKKVLITGVLGQDGANMAEYLLSSTDHQVYGMQRRSGTPNYDNIESFKNNDRFHLVDGDLTDSASIDNLVKKIKPDFLINFGANSFVAVSWEMPLQVFETNTLGVIRCLEAIKKFKPDCRFYSAGSSEEFGDVDYSPQDIKHPIKPRSPYGASKAAARHLVKVYRESYDIFAVHSILFNHEGIRRGEEFVTRKITKKVAEIYHKLKAGGEEFEPLQLGNVDAKRDWSDSKDFMRAVWLMLGQDKPKDYVLASGRTHSVKEFVQVAFQKAGISGLWSGTGLDAKYLHGGPPVLAEINEKWYRPAEVQILHGDASEIKKDLGWEPEISFDQMVKDMVDNDIKNYT
jgi:GDPmannose 4,6-dehydratase